MGLSRNKVAVSEGAAGSPPFYGESGIRNGVERLVSTWRNLRYSRYRCRNQCRTKRNTFHGVSRKTRRDPSSMLFCFQGSDRSLKEKRFGGIAQLGEHLPCKQGVMGSNPIISTKRAHSSAG